jgi:hypothetical protein
MLSPYEFQLVHKYFVHSARTAIMTEPIGSINLLAFLSSSVVSNASSKSWLLGRLCRQRPVCLMGLRCVRPLFKEMRSAKCFHPPYQRVSHAEWSKEHEYASIETGRITCWPPTTMGIECASSRATWLSQREKKL